ncbi:keratin, type I cytoskeletal 15-like [Bufo bufo]|uniref:keratin, type I cytoskeletal 15-like n=1 Tax=Bufo bufo TaxID=8384 RepID=UPI001ABE7D38|nr:keratin, type I cytoskeletal 15-like [Bufo bufo]
MSVKQSSGSCRGSSGSSIRVSSGIQSSGGHFGGGRTSGSYVGSMSTGFGGGHMAGSGFSRGSGIGTGCGFGGSGFSGGSGFGVGSGLGGSYGYGGGAGFEGLGFGVGQGVSSGSWGDQGLVGPSEKLTMQNLNDRLAVYLEKVRSLEEANAELERRIHQWYESHGPKPDKDYSHYYKKIEELQKKIQDTTINNCRVVLDIDNARLAADDFKLKYENELFMRQSVESDINGMRKLFDEMKHSRSDLEAELEHLKAELEFLKKNHEEEMKALRGQAQGTVNVDMKAAPGIDLHAMLDKVRQEYELLSSEKHKEIEAWYQNKTEEIRHQMTTDSKEIQTTSTQVTELRRTFQGLEIELQAQMSMKGSLEGTLAETEGRYCMQLAHLQELIQKVELELTSLRCEIENQRQEYNNLLDVKTRLEKEIGTYRSLLDNEGAQISKGSSSSSSSNYSSSGSHLDRQGGSPHVRIRTEDADGRVISTRDQYHQSGHKM